MSEITPANPEQRRQTLTKLHGQILGCIACPLHQSRTQAVPGVGSIEAEVMLVGEAPGHQEDIQGKPFVGPAGKLLDTLLGRIGLNREKVFISNVLKCRPPQNRDPRPEEAETCLPYLRHQFKLVQPKAVVILGRHALERMLPGVGPISRVHGQIFHRMEVAFMPVYHPAAALHNPSLVGELERDFDRVKNYLEEVLSTNKRAAEAGTDSPAASSEPTGQGGQSAAGIEQLRLPQ
ncbi:MAG: uracil-DNA glycosylase family protein [Candidatus Dormibacteraceae bacterium]